MSSESDENDLPLDVLEAAQNAVSSLIPKKSSRQYESTYKDFMNWCSSKNLKNVTESVILAYFEYKAKKLRPPTLWSIYSMLKKTLDVKQNVDIGKYSKLVPYLKNKNVGYRPKKSKVLNKTEIEKFIKEAPDQIFLLLKNILIMGIYGACRRIELLNLNINNIEDKGSVIIVKIEDSKTHSQRTFVISNSSHIELYRKYRGLRPANTTSSRFFIKYSNGKCANQVVGINKIRNVPKEIATYLKLPEAQCYTGHCFRRSAATLAADSGTDFVSLKRLGGWRSSQVAEGYIEESIERKIKVSKNMLNVPNSETSPTEETENETPVLNQPTFSMEMNVQDHTVSLKESSSGENELCSELRYGGLIIRNCTVTNLNVNVLNK